MYKLFKFILSVIYYSSFKSIDATDEAHLLNYLLNSYDPAARPVLFPHKSLVVKLSLSLIQIQGLDEKRQILTSNLWIEQVISKEARH